MKLELQITARDFELTEPIEDAIRKEAEKLDLFYEDIMGCRVLVELPHQHQQKGVLYHVRIDLTVPGSEIVVKREPHEDLYVAIGEAFDTALRQLQDYAEKRRGDVKRRKEMPRARISKLFHDRGYGFLATEMGLEVYFHENSVVGTKFEDLQIGTEVYFVEAEGEKGPQASTVKLAKG
ncbi:MAG: HPF/RaiA family ribosome-associated protein [Desulfobacterales bacterium]|nr:HPF/RaiA family ribosome-associated protein [Desulfobacterales bacterium]